MRWKTKPTPKLGDTRWVKKFAWLKVETDSGESLWLESYYVKEHYFKHLRWSAIQTVTPEQYDKLMQEEEPVDSYKDGFGTRK